jgi:galactokinase
MAQLFAAHFGRSPAVEAYAPGRIEFIGNHLDYNRGTVLGASLDRGIHVALAARADVCCRLFSHTLGEEVTIQLDDLKPLSGHKTWANYPLGVAAAMRAEGLPITRGFDLFISSSLPAGAGMGSSAALELATAYGLAALNGFELDQKGMVRICRRAENEFVGMPCGILDQGVSAFGLPDHLVQIDCLTESFNQIAMPSAGHLWLFDSAKKHELSDSAYSERNRECIESFEILERFDRSAVSLARISPEFVRQHQSFLDETHLKRALHVTEENERVMRAIDALHQGDLHSLGRLLTASHRSSQHLFENSCPELDYLVDHLIAQEGVYGARLSGGGFGGAVLALTNEDFGDSASVKQIAANYEMTFGRKPSVYQTRPGKAWVGWDSNPEPTP